MNIRKFYRKSNRIKTKKLSITELRTKASIICRLFGNLFRRSELNIKNSSYIDTFKPGLINNFIFIQYKDINLNFTLSATGKIKIKIKSKKLTTNIISDEKIVEKIKKFLNENSSKLID